MARADSQGGGFTNGFASRLRLADGSRVFVKAVSSLQSPEVFASSAQEVRVARALPRNVPAPRQRWTTEQDESLVLACDDVSGRTPQRPWQPEELRVVLDILTPLAAVLTPVPAALPQLDTTADIDRDFSFWRRLAGGEEGTDPRLVSEQLRQHLGTLAALEADGAALAAGETAVHFDMREDNLLLTGDGRALACDWNRLSIAAPWVDWSGCSSASTVTGSTLKLFLPSTR